jgi:hypothetical protein
LSLVLFIFSVLAFSYPVTQVFAQGGGQCDSNPACNPASGTCCGQCDPGPACNPNDPNAIPCCSLEGNNMTNGSQPHGGFEPPRRPLKKNDLDPRLVKEMEKMKHELQACRSLQEEIRGQQQTARRQAPARCQPNSDTQRRLDHAHDTVLRACRFIIGISPGRMRTGQGSRKDQEVQHILTESRNFREEVCFQIHCKDRQTGRKLNTTDCAKSTQKYYDHLWNE